MIQLSGPEFGAPGSRVCISVSGVGSGFSVVAVVGKAEIPTTVVLDPKNHRATVCFILPKADSGGVTVTAANAAGRGKSMVVLSL